MYQEADRGSSVQGGRILTGVRAIDITPRPAPEEIGQIFREEFGRSVAALIRYFGDIDVAEESVQEAFAVGLSEWRATGLPPNPGGWITTTARRRAIDRLRRDARGRELLRSIEPLASSEASSHGESGAPLKDERLRLIFTCCHPALSREAQVALTLRLLGGLSVSEVARSFIVADATMAQRLVRAKRKIKAARIPYRVPDDHELPERLRSVLAVIYLVYNAGLSRSDHPDLSLEAVRLARIMRGLMPDEEEVAGLLGLLLLIESRRPSRTRPDGSFVPLEEQDRRGWDQMLVVEGQALVRWCLERNRPGPYQIQAAINAVHADAATIDDTDWLQILALYDHLLEFSPTPVVALNRAVAIAEVENPAVALALVEELDLDNYYAFHAVRADLLHRAGRVSEAEIAYQRAASLAPTTAESEFLARGERGKSRERS